MNIHGYNPSSMSKAAFRCLTAGGGSIFRRDDGYFDHWAYDRAHSQGIVTGCDCQYCNGQLSGGSFPIDDPLSRGGF